MWGQVTLIDGHIFVFEDTSLIDKMLGRHNKIYLDTLMNLSEALARDRRFHDVQWYSGGDLLSGKPGAKAPVVGWRNRGGLGLPGVAVEAGPGRAYLGGMANDKPGLESVIAAAKAQAPGRGLPPVHLWNPAHCGEIDIVIKKDGLWFHEGTPIGREALVRLFSTVLRKDPDGFHLVTPVEKMRITVEDAPFIATRVDRLQGEDGGDRLKFLTNVGDEVEAGPENEIRVEMCAATGEPRPYLHVRRGLEALIARPVFYELVEMAQERETPEGPRLGVASNGTWFPIGPAGAHRL